MPTTLKSIILQDLFWLWPTGFFGSLAPNYKIFCNFIIWQKNDNFRLSPGIQRSKWHFSQIHGPYLRISIKSAKRHKKIARFEIISSGYVVLSCTQTYFAYPYKRQLGQRQSKTLRIRCFPRETVHKQINVSWWSHLLSGSALRFGYHFFPGIYWFKVNFKCLTVPKLRHT